MTLGNTLLDTRTFDTRYQLGTWNLANAVPQSLLSYTHSFNADGNLEAITDNLPSAQHRSFGYDEIHRLTSAVGPWGPGISCSGQTYTYDKNGNRLCKNESGTATTSYEYSSNSNRLASMDNGAITISYDANGNTTADGTHTYGYSDANRLAMMDGGWTLYDYDGENRRVRKSNAQTTYFFYDPSGRILTGMIHNEEAYGGGNGFGQDYIYLPDAPIARVDWSVVNNPNYHQCSPPKGGICPPPRIAIADLLYYHTDHLGTPLAMTNESGELVWKAEYLPFGDLFSNTISTVGNNLRFPGQYFDAETGLHQNWFRDYSPKTGRYQEADPLWEDLRRKEFGQPYSYARNASTKYVDPRGLDVRTCCRPLASRLVRGYDHCYVESNSGGIRRTWGLHVKNGYGVPIPDEGSDTGGRCSTWRTDPNCELTKCVANACARYPIEKYSDVWANLEAVDVSVPFGRNSNTFTKCVTRHCGIYVDPDVYKDAPGWNQPCPGF